MPSATPSAKPSSSKPPSARREAEGETSSWIDSILSSDDFPNNTTKQMLLGGVSGWVTGFLAMKIGKAAATAIGGGIILLQIASHQGYININWSRLQRDVSDVTTKIAEGKDQKKKDWTAKLEKKIDKFADQVTTRVESTSRRWYDKVFGRESRDLHLFMSSFAVGTLVGIATGG